MKFRDDPETVHIQNQQRKHQINPLCVDLVPRYYNNG